MSEKFSKKENACEVIKLEGNAPDDVILLLLHKSHHYQTRLRSRVCIYVWNPAKKENACEVEGNAPDDDISLLLHKSPTIIKQKVEYAIYAICMWNSAKKCVWSN